MQRAMDEHPSRVERDDHAALKSPVAFSYCICLLRAGVRPVFGSERWMHLTLDVLLHVQVGGASSDDAAAI